MARDRRSTGEADENDDVTTSGWDAISAAFDGLYGRQEPRHYGTIIKWALGGDDPLDGISAYRAADPAPHWHVVSYGMSELYQKHSQNPDESGWGFEFTFRVARRAKDKEPPMWALSFLQNLGRYVFRTGNVFEPNHHMNLNGPIALEDEHTRIRAVVFAPDPQLPAPIDTPNGRLRFLQVVGITLDELDAAMDWNTDGLVELLAERHPRLVTDLARRSILDDPAAAQVREAAEREGSSLSGVFTPVAAWRLNAKADPPAVAVTMNTLELDRTRRMLAGRTRHGREFELWTPKQAVRFVPGQRSGWKVDGTTLVIRLSPALADEMRAGLEGEGTYRWPGLANLTLRVKPAAVS